MRAPEQREQGVAAEEASVSVSIERMTLRGVAPDARGAVAAAVERALGALIAARGLPPAMEGRAVVEVEGGSLRVTAGPGAEAIGEAIAAGIYEGWSAEDARRG